MKYKIYIIIVLIITCTSIILAQPNWLQIKSNATFLVADTNGYRYPEILPINVGGWEDGLYVSRDGKHLYSTYLPIDVLSWLGDFQPCIDFTPYYRGPLLGIDTVSNIFGCSNYIHSDIIKATRLDTSSAFNPWQSSNLNKPMTFDGAACGVLSNSQTFDVFVYTTDTGSNGMEIMFLKNVSTNPNYAGAVPILSSPQYEDNPHIERLPNGNLLLFFDRERFVYFSLSSDEGVSWSTPTLITNVINDQAPYDIQPHLWNDGTDWWIYFCANDSLGFRSIYRSKQTIENDWNSWAPKELVLSPTGINGGFGNVIGVGEPSLTQWGDLYFVTVYGNTLQSDTTDVFDCDPWLMKRKTPIVNSIKPLVKDLPINVYPNPAQKKITIKYDSSDSNSLMLNIYNVQGELLKSIKDINSIETISVENLQKGLYVLRFLKSNQVASVIKLLIVE